MIDYSLLDPGQTDDEGREIIRCGRCGQPGALERLTAGRRGEVLVVHAARLVPWGAGVVTREAVASCRYRDLGRVPTRARG